MSRTSRIILAALAALWLGPGAGVPGSMPGPVRPEPPPRPPDTRAIDPYGRDPFKGRDFHSDSFSERQRAIERRESEYRRQMERERISSFVDQSLDGKYGSARGRLVTLLVGDKTILDGIQSLPVDLRQQALHEIALQVSLS